MEAVLTRPTTQEQVIDLSQYVIFTGSTHPSLAQRVGANLKIETHQVASEHDDGETYIELPVSVRDRHVYLIQSPAPKLQNTALMEIKQTAWTAGACGAESVTAIIPYFPYARADQMNKKRMCKTVELVTTELWNSGITRMVTIDLHSEQSAIGVGRPRRWDNLFGSYVLVPALEEFSLDINRIRVISPDAGATKRARYINKMLNIPRATNTADKERDLDTFETKTVLYGDFADTIPVIVDDLINTGGTIRNVSTILESRGAEPAFVLATHGVLPHPALDNLMHSSIRDGGILITDTIPQPPEVLSHPKIKVYSIEPLISEVIRRSIGKRGGMSELFSAVAPKVSRIYS